MLNYAYLRPFLFSLPPEVAHKIALTGLNWLYKLGLARVFFQQPLPSRNINIMGLIFPNRIGLAAGLDKNGEYLDGLSTLGFGFIEIGTLTPKPQPGNPKPRLFRLPKSEALINKMGFNNIGIDAALENIRKSSYTGILGINLGKNAETPIEYGYEDYVIGLKKVASHASYIAINISSPNTAQLRKLQFGDAFAFLLKTLKTTRDNLTKKIPLLIKVSPDLTETEIEHMADVILAHQIDGVIATNTTVTKEGGLSGAPLKPLSEKVTALFVQYLKNKIPIISVGGIATLEDVQKRLDMGATLIQLYTGLIYQGPCLVQKCMT